VGWYIWYSEEGPGRAAAPRRCFRSADTTTLQVSSTRRATLGDRTFPVAAARAWNSLSLETRACSSLLTFRRETKSRLFCQSYGWRGAVYSDGQQTSALSCATVLDLDFCKVAPQLCDGSTLIHDICSSSSSSSIVVVVVVAAAAAAAAAAAVTVHQSTASVPLTVLLYMVRCSAVLVCP